MTATRRPGIPNAGPSRRSDRRTGPVTRAVVLSGTLAWVERDGCIAVLRVRETNRRGRMLRGKTVTVDLREARVSVPDRDGDGTHSACDLLPGERVTVRGLVDRRLRAVPQPLAARQLTVHDFAF